MGCGLHEWIQDNEMTAIMMVTTVIMRSVMMKCDDDELLYIWENGTGKPRVAQHNNNIKYMMEIQKRKAKYEAPNDHNWQVLTKILIELSEKCTRGVFCRAKHCTIWWLTFNFGKMYTTV